MTKKLAPKQLLFCQEYLIDLNARQAAIRAGYSEKTASEMGYENLNKPHIAEYITELKKERSDKTAIDAAWVLNAAKKIYDRCMQEEAVVDKEGGTTGEFKFEHSGANKALDTIGKHIDVQAFIDKKAVDTTLKIIDDGSNEW
jgi:phage terminase small subunit